MLEFLLDNFEISPVGAGKALRTAAENGRTKVVLLLQSRTNIDSIYVDIALTSAAQNRHSEIVKLLVQNFSGISAIQAAFALQCAAESGDIDSVKLFLQNFAEIYMFAIIKATKKAAENGHAEILTLLLEKHPNPLDMQPILHAEWQTQAKPDEEIIKILENYIELHFFQ